MTVAVARREDCQAHSGENSDVAALHLVDGVESSWPLQEHDVNGLLHNPLVVLTVGGWGLQLPEAKHQR